MKDRSQLRWVQCAILIIGGVCLLPGSSFGGPYRDIHGNPGEITLSKPHGDLSATGIDYTVAFELIDSVGATSGEFVIESEMKIGRDVTDDFVLRVCAKTTRQTPNAAELVFRNHPTKAPKAPILRLLSDCSSSRCSLCTVDAIYEDPQWGPWIIRGTTSPGNAGLAECNQFFGVAQCFRSPFYSPSCG